MGSLTDESKQISRELQIGGKITTSIEALWKQASYTFWL